MTRFGYTLMTEQSGPKDLVRYAVSAEHTGFDFDRSAQVPQTPAPDADTLRILRKMVAPELAEVYPQFAEKIFGVPMGSVVPA